MTFDVLNRATWPDCLIAVQVAAIYQRNILGLKKACQRHSFIPAPYRVKPYRWRKGDVIRDLDGLREVPRGVYARRA